jgi:hypothetical protein
MVPVHYIPASQLLYVAFVDRVNNSALYAVEKMLECHTEPCLALQSHVLRALEELRSRPRATEVLIDSISDPWEMADSVLSHVERLRGVDVKVSGFGGFVWVRIVSPSGHTDVIFRVTVPHPLRNQD